MQTNTNNVGMIIFSKHILPSELEVSNYELSLILLLYCLCSCDNAIILSMFMLLFVGVVMFGLFNGSESVQVSWKPQCAVNFRILESYPERQQGINVISC